VHVIDNVFPGGGVWRVAEAATATVVPKEVVTIHCKSSKAMKLLLMSDHIVERKKKEAVCKRIDYKEELGGKQRLDGTLVVISWSG